MAAMSATATECLDDLERANREAHAAFLAKCPVVDGKRKQLRGAKAAYRRLLQADRAYIEALRMAHADVWDAWMDEGKVQP